MSVIELNRDVEFRVICYLSKAQIIFLNYKLQKFFTKMNAKKNPLETIYKKLPNNKLAVSKWNENISLLFDACKLVK